MCVCNPACYGHEQRQRQGDKGQVRGHGHGQGQGNGQGDRERLWDGLMEGVVKSKNSICVHLQMWTANNEVADVDSKKFYKVVCYICCNIKAKQHVMHRFFVYHPT